MGIKLNKDIMRSESIDKQTRAEIQKIIKRANSRIRNLKQSGVVSTALRTLEAERGEIDRFSVFSIKGMDTDDIKDEYARSVAFLNNATSTVTGAKRFIKEHIQEELKIKDFDIANKLMGEIAEYEINGNGEINIFRYKETLSQIRTNRQQFEADKVNAIEQLNNVLSTVSRFGGSLLEVLRCLI